jgi:hypothetical protein
MRPVRPYEDYVVSPVYGPAEPGQIDKITTSEVQADIAVGDGVDNLLVDSTRVGKPVDAAISTASVSARSGPLSESEAFQALREFRDAVIARETENWEPHRSILREAMIETLVIQRVRDPDDWFRKVPQFQRAGTNAVEKQRHLDQICEIVDRIEGDGSLKPNGSPSTGQSLPLLRSPPRPESSGEHSLQ